MPWLYYDPTLTEDILNSQEISTEFRDGSNLSFVAAKYDVEGKFVSLEELTASKISSRYYKMNCTKTKSPF